MCTGNSKLLSLSCWNVHGLSKKFYLGAKLSNDDFLRSVTSNDFIILTETWSSDHLSLPGFHLFTIPAKKYRIKKHGRSSGGLALAFKIHLNEGITLISCHDDYIWCKLDKHFFCLEKDIFLCAIYVPPKDSPYFNPDIFHDLESDIAKFSKDGFVILAGDFNARTGCALDFVANDNCPHIPGDNILPQCNLGSRKNCDNHINEHGKNVLDICKTGDLRILNGRTKGDSFGKITFHSPQGISTVDYIIASHEMLNLIESLVVKPPSIFSDHSQIICWIKCSPTTSSQPIPKTQHKLFNLPKQYIWDKNSSQKYLNTLKKDEFQSKLSLFEQTDFASNNEGVQLATKQFTDLLNEISLNSLQLTCQKKSSRNKLSKKWFDNDCKILRRSLKVLSNKTHKDPYNRELREEYHKTNRDFKTLIKLKKTMLLNSKIDNLISNQGNYEFWNYLKLINEDNPRDKTKHEVPIDNLFTHFKNLHSKPNPTSSLKHEIFTLEDYKDNYNCLDEPFSLKDIENATKLLKSRKAPGSDRIRNEMLKTGLSYLKASICKLFNLVLKCGFFPPTWCEGIITPIYKSGDRSDPSNYRGICINSCLGKLFTSVLNIRLQNHLIKENILHRAQIGFLPNHRTSDHIFTLRTLIDKNVTHTSKGKLFTCFIDFKKAFDSIWHDGLCYKLLKNKIGGKFYDLIKNLYSKSKCSIKLNHQRTEFFDYANGVRQGCILSPMLFNLYLNEIPTLLDAENTDPVLLPDGSRLNCLLYADDLVLISHTATGLQTALSTLAQFCSDWLLNINPKKTKVLIFQKKLRKSTLDKQRFYINSDKIEIASNYTYLGVNFSTTGNFRDHKTHLKEKTRRSIFATRRNLDFSKLPIDIVNKIFDSLFLPILMYGSEVWGIYDKVDYNSWEKDTIERTHIYFSKLFLGVNKQCPNVACRNELGRLSLKGKIDLNIIKFWIHLENLSEDNIAKQCLYLSKEMAGKNQLSLMQKVDSICKASNLNISTFDTKNSNAFTSRIRLTVNKTSVSHQLDLLHLNKKLIFYSSFKKDCQKAADFLDSIKNPLHKKQINKFRLGNHKLRIETGRHNKTPEHLRICTFCNLNEIEDESHFLFTCHHHKNLRTKYFNEINDKYQNFNNLDNNSKILFLFNSADPFVCRTTAAYIYNSMLNRQSILV